MTRKRVEREYIALAEREGLERVEIDRSRFGSTHASLTGEIGGRRVEVRISISQGALSFERGVKYFVSNLRKAIRSGVSRETIQTHAPLGGLQERLEVAQAYAGRPVSRNG